VDNNKEKDLWNLVNKLTISNIEAQEKKKEFNLGLHCSASLQFDIKHLMINLSRYKFISKLFRFEENYSILELGCSEGIGYFFFTQSKSCRLYNGIDSDEKAINWAKNNLLNENVEFIEDNFLNHSYGKFDVVISIDVIEHINKEIEDQYLDTIYNNLDNNGTAIIGTPNIMMNPYASEASKIAHINLFSQERLYKLCKSKFNNVFIFNMNDEVVHTGFAPMSCYIFAVGCNKK